jgi:thiosulfate dehydrogenase (quinone) large subunit
VSTTTRVPRTRVTLPPAPSRDPRSLWDALLESWRTQSPSLALLRAFLGATFVYAGIQKLSDPNFLHTGSPDFIGSQLQAFAQGSPIGWLLRGLAPAAVPVGIGIALAEIAVGLGTLAGIAPVQMAVGGFLINLTLTLSATWHVHPYFIGSDSMYAVAWLAYGLGVLEMRRRTRRAAVGKLPGKRSGPVHSTRGISRREFVRGAALAGATAATAAVAVALAGSPTAAAPFTGSGSNSGPSDSVVEGSPSSEAQGPTSAGEGPSGSGTGAGSSSPTAGQGGTSVPGTPIAELASIPVGGAVGFEAPGVGAAALVRLSKNDVVAYSRTCTHAGCLVGYNQSARLLVCPCHGAEFDPANGATPVAGPAPAPLAKVDVTIDPSTGRVVLPA